MLTDSYLLMKNEGYLCVPAGYLSKHNRKTSNGGGGGGGTRGSSTPGQDGHLKKIKSDYNEGGGRRSGGSSGGGGGGGGGHGQTSSRTANLERISEVEGEDKSNYEGMNEGGRGAAGGLFVPLQGLEGSEDA